jgi:uncharacterized protein YndB with AHSA1/START domain
MAKPIVTFKTSVTSKATPEEVYAVLANPSTHARWAGEDAPDQGFAIIELEAPNGRAKAGTIFTSRGTAGKKMIFHDTNTVTEAIAPHRFAFETQARLVRPHRPTWEARFVHRYDVVKAATGSRIDYTGQVFPQNYRPYWLHPLMRPATRVMVPRFMAKNMANLARMAEKAPVAGR